MNYDFDTSIDRRGSSSLKWSVESHELPMWVADMDFQTAPEIIEAFNRRIKHGVFGYAVVPDQWYDAYRMWWKKRHAFEIEEAWLIFSTGVVPAISSAVRKLTTVGEKVLIQSPVYNIFYNSIVNNGRHILESPLLLDGQTYNIDYDDLERKLSDPQTTLMIFCNPHNPVGKVWNRDTVQKIGRLCMKHHVVVLSDEIHCDLTDPGTEYIPFASVSEECMMNSVSCISPSKAFNLAGLQTAAVVAPNEVLRSKMDRALNTDEVAEPSAFAPVAAIAAFTQGETWLDELRDYLFRNKTFVRSFIERHVPQIKVIPSDATYLLWLDCRTLTERSYELYRFLREQTGLYLTDGSHYGTGGQGFLRMNVACPRSRIEDALSRLERGIRAFVRMQD